MYIHDCIIFSQIINLEDNIEAIESFLICCIYRPPNSSVQYFNDMIDNFERAFNFNDNVIIMSDFNIDLLNKNHMFIINELINEPTAVSSRLFLKKIKKPV